jgi:hypothetical protein
VKTVQMLQSDLTAKLATLGWLLRKVGPYLAIEILMPGGTLIAIALFLYRRRNAAPDGTTLALRAFAIRVLEQVRERVTPMRDRLLPMLSLARVRATV